MISCKNALERNLLGCCVGLLLFALLIFINWIFISKERKKKEKEGTHIICLVMSTSVFLMTSTFCFCCSTNVRVFKLISWWHIVNDCLQVTAVWGRDAFSTSIFPASVQLQFSNLSRGHISVQLIQLRNTFQTQNLKTGKFNLLRQRSRQCWCQFLHFTQIFAPGFVPTCHQMFHQNICQIFC